MILQFLMLLILGWGIPSQGIALDGTSHIKSELIQEGEAIQPGQPFWVAIHLKLEKEWHVYWKNPGDAGIPLKVEWLLPAGFEASPLQWPFPEKFTTSDMVGFGYSDEVILLSQITPPAHLDLKENIELQAKVNWLVCSSFTCQPGNALLSVPLVVSDQKPSPRQGVAALFKEARSKIPQTHVEIKTIRKDGMVQLEVAQGKGETEETIRGVYFFPEDQNVIDPLSEPTVASTDSNRYFVNLKGSDEIGAGTKFLKGVLVLHKQKGSEESVEALDIDSPIEEEGDAAFLSYFTSADSPAIGYSKAIAQPASSFSFEGGLGLALLFAFLGGMILNLMPCVLPVISFKVMSFVKMSGQSRSLTLKHGLMFSFGVLVSFWVLASAMLVLRAYGQSVGWGFQLQEPLFVVILATLLFIFSLSLFGLFEWGMFFASWAGQTEADTVKKSSGYAGSFFSGVLATAVATPCTGPFLGSAVGFAVTLSILPALMIFTSLALGMCFPYLLLAAFPSFLRFLPKPGQWMETFKQLMGFFLLATVLWLLWVFSAQTNAFSLICLLAGFLCFSIGAWIYGRACSPLARKSTRLFAYASILLFAYMGVSTIIFPRATWSIQESAGDDHWIGWENFSPERVVQLREAGKPILIDFTAKWCLICQANHLVLNSEDVKQELDKLGVVKMKADWTKSDPIITEALSKFGRNSVPLYVLYGAGEPVILPQVLTPDVVAEHLSTAIRQDIALSK